MSPFVVEKFVPELEEEEVKLSDKCVNEEGIGESTPCITSDECHQKSKTYQHHHIDILEGRISLRSYIVVNSCIWIDHNEDPVECYDDTLEDNDQDS